VPQAVFCLLSALQFHELTTQLLRRIWIAMPRGSHTPRMGYPPIKMVQMVSDVYSTVNVARISEAPSGDGFIQREALPIFSWLLSTSVQIESGTIIPF